MLSVIDYSSFLSLRRDAATAREAQAQRDKAGFKRKYDSLLATTARDGVPGDKYLRDLELCLTQFEGFTRSPSQIDFHKAFIDANLPHIYGVSDFERYRERILRERGIASMQYEILICTPRRWGKTTSVAMFIAASLYCVPNTWISCFSTGQRASSLLLDQAAKFFNMLPNAKERIIKKNTEQFFVKGLNASDMRQFFSFPSSVAGLKGVGARTVILEEASRLNAEVFTEVVVPLLGVSHTSLIGISTPLEENNFYSQLLLAKKPNGASLFKVLNVELVCAACREKSIASCPHSVQLPSWKSTARADLVKTLMANNSQMWEREQLGVINTRDSSAYDLPSVLRFADPATHVSWDTMDLQDNHLYVAFDPAGGGLSEAAIVSGFVDTGSKQLIITSADSSTLANDQVQETFLNRHLERIRAERKFCNALVVLIIERNFGGSVLASRIANICAKFAPIRVVSADPQAHKRVGVVTSEAVKERGRSDLQRLLRLDLIKFAQKSLFLTSNPGMQDVIVKQLQSFKFEVKDVAGDKQKVKLTGKGYGQNDDLSICLLLLNFWSGFCISNGERCFI